MDSPRDALWGDGLAAAEPEEQLEWLFSGGNLPRNAGFRKRLCDQCHRLAFNVQLSACGHSMCLDCFNLKFKRGAKPHWLSRFLPYRTLNLPLTVECKAVACRAVSDRVLLWNHEVRNHDQRARLIDLAERFAVANDTSTWGRKVVEVMFALLVFGVCELVWSLLSGDKR